MYVTVSTTMKGRIISVTLSSQALKAGEGAGGRLKLPNLGRNLFHSGKLSERTIGNSSRKFTERLQSPPKFDVLLRPWLNYCRIY